MLWVLPLLPPAVALLAVTLRRWPRLAVGSSLAGAAATLALALWAAAEAPSATWAWGAGLELTVAAQGFARTAVVLVPFVAAPILAYAAVTEHDGRARLLTFMAAFVGAMLLLVLAADFLTLLIGWELVGALSWVLIAHSWRDPENARSAARAFVTTRLGDLGLFVAAGMAFAATGSFRFAGLGDIDRPDLDAIAFGVVLAAAAKSAQVPFSPWLFAAMAGPTPVSALLHSATLVAAGAYVLVRLAGELSAVGWFGPAVASVGVLTALAGGVVALAQTDAKRVLAASTSAQYGLMFVAIGAGSSAAAGAHLVSHALLKSLLFLGAGIAIHAAGSGSLERMRLGRTLPYAAVLSSVGALALAAMPPLGAAWTKGTIVASAFHASAWLGAGVLLASFLTALYAGRYQLLAYAPSHVASARRYRPAATELGAMAILAVASVALSLLWLPAASELVERATGGEINGGAWWELVAEVLLLGGAAAMLWLFWQRARLVSLALPVRMQAAAANWLGLPTATHVLVDVPVIWSSRRLARFDDRVIDAGIRGVGRLARLVSRLFALRGEWTFDGIVRIASVGTWRAALASRISDERLIDQAVEQTARGVDEAGGRTRLLQSGLSHQYFVMIAAGLAAGALVLALAGL